MAKKAKNSDKPKPKRGRPHEGRVPMICHVTPDTIKTIDSKVNKDIRALNTRGKIVEQAFNLTTTSSTSSVN